MSGVVWDLERVAWVWCLCSFVVDEVTFVIEFALSAFPELAFVRMPLVAVISSGTVSIFEVEA